MATTRAPALPAEERRAMIVSATRRLLLEHGPMVTTRQIAEAAGIAEGTIFRVFCDKETLVDAAVEAAFDPAPLDEAIAAIDAALPLHDRLARAVEAIRAHHLEMFQLMSSLAARGARREPRPLADLTALAELLAPDAHRFDRDAVRLARVLRAMTLALSPPLFGEDPPLAASEIVGLFLGGVTKGAPC